MTMQTHYLMTDYKMYYVFLPVYYISKTVPITDLYDQYIYTFIMYSIGLVIDSFCLVFIGLVLLKLTYVVDVSVISHMIDRVNMVIDEPTA